MVFLALPALLGLTLIAWGIYLLLHRPRVHGDNFYASYPQRQINVGGKTFRAAVADTIARRAQGLSGRESMAEDEAMLFTFPLAMRYAFWMKDMRFRLDIVWIWKGQVVDISENVPVPAQSPIAGLRGFRPRAAADAVLEINAGSARKFGIKIGDRIKL